MESNQQFIGMRILFSLKIKAIIFGKKTTTELDLYPDKIKEILKTKYSYDRKICSEYDLKQRECHFSLLIHRVVLTN